MKKLIITVLLIIAATIAVPFAIIYSISGFYSPEKEQSDVSADEEYPKTVSVYMHKEDKVVEMDTSEYLKGVVAAEMPASFETEALKAQAVAARSYLLSHIAAYKKNGTPPEHKGADTCTDYTHCKAWISEADRKAAWKSEEADANWAKICAAVDNTSGIIMTYGGGPVNAVFHSTSSGNTENSEDVWGSAVPYLKSVSSPGDEVSPKFSSQASMTEDEFKKKAEENIENVNWDSPMIGDITRSEAGGIVTITIGGQTIKGTEFRTIFGLRSTNAQITVENGMVNIAVKGYGHGVGMSQYGANYLAQEGKTYEEILKTYYTGVELGSSKSIQY